MMMTPKELGMEIAANLKKLRKQRKLSQKALAEKAGLSYGSMKRFEQTGEISLESLLKIAIVLTALLFVGQNIFNLNITALLASAGIIGLANLALACRPFTKLRALLCGLMAAAFAGAVALLPKVFFLHTEALTGKDWLFFAVVTTCGVGILLAGKWIAGRKNA